MGYLYRHDEEEEHHLDLGPLWLHWRGKLDLWLVWFFLGTLAVMTVLLFAGCCLWGRCPF